MRIKRKLKKVKFELFRVKLRVAVLVAYAVMLRFACQLYDGLAKIVRS